MLTQAEIDHFRRVGYLKRTNFLSVSLMEEISQALNSLFSKPSDPTYVDNNGTVLRVLDIYGRGDPFGRLIQSSLVLDLVESLLGPNIVFNRFRHNHASMNRPGENFFRLHRDALQWSRPVVGLLIYLDHSSVQSGCTYVIPASHHLPFVGEPKQGPAGIRANEHSAYSAFIDQAVPIEVNAGGALLFDSGVFHTASPNKGTVPRRTLAISYQAVDELAPDASDRRRVLVRGHYVYRGWDDPALRAAGVRVPTEATDTEKGS